MVRQGRFKYVHVHGEDEQLFDLERDPGEWEDLSHAPAYTAIVERMKACILDRFDPDEIAREVDASLTRRKLIRLAMERNGTEWE
jgi:hypothetical protein